MYFSHKSQNHSIIQAGKNFKDSPVQPPAQSRFLRALSSWALKTSKGGYCKTSVCSQYHCLRGEISMGRKFFLSSPMNPLFFFPTYTPYSSLSSSLSRDAMHRAQEIVLGKTEAKVALRTSAWSALAATRSPSEPSSISTFSWFVPD